MNYWDTSALLKLYVNEPDSAFFLDFVTSTSEPVFTSAVAQVEALSAFFRKESAGDLRASGARVLLDRFQEDCQTGRVMLVPFGSDVIEEAGRLAALAYRRRHPILVRSLDLIHAATFSSLRATTMLATDQRLRDLCALLKAQVLP